MANIAYKTLQSGAPAVQGDYRAQGWDILGNYGENKEGFIGCAFVAPEGSHTVVAYGGTDPWSKQDLSADAKIALQMMPTQIFSALNIFEDARNMQRRRGPMCVVGHSLGGALAQVVGTLKVAPFVTFNAPGMAKNLVNWRPIYKGSGKLANGMNYRLRNDKIGSFGEHLGAREVLDGEGTIGIFDAHSMDTVVHYIWRNPTLKNLIPPPLNARNSSSEGG
jgi:hypothetical protein